MKLKTICILFCMMGALCNANAQTSSKVYEYEYKANGNMEDCVMKRPEFTSYKLENSIMFHISKSSDGPAYLFTFCLMSLTEGSPIIYWANTSDTESKEIKITIKLSNGKVLSPKAFIYDNTRPDLRGSQKLGSVLLAFGGTYDSIVQQLTQNDIESITYMGKSLTLGDVKTSPTISSMINDIRLR